MISTRKEQAKLNRLEKSLDKVKNDLLSIRRNADNKNRFPCNLGAGYHFKYIDGLMDTMKREIGYCRNYLKKIEEYDKLFPEIKLKKVNK